MYVGRDFSPQEWGESEVFGLDFINDLEAGEYLNSSVWTITIKRGYDPLPSIHLEGPSLPIIPLGSNFKTATIQRIGGLFPDVTYTVHAYVITSLGNTRSLWSHIRGVNTESAP